MIGAKYSVDLYRKSSSEESIETIPIIASESYVITESLIVDKKAQKQITKSVNVIGYTPRFLSCRLLDCGTLPEHAQ